MTAERELQGTDRDVPCRCACTLGALGLFGCKTGRLNERDLSLAQALADVASIALTQNQERDDHASLTAQLQTALDCRVVIEQAKGVLAQQGQLEMQDAFAVLRQYARDQNLRLTELATAVVQSRPRPAAARARPAQDQPHLTPVAFCPPTQRRRGQTCTMRTTEVNVRAASAEGADFIRTADGLRR